VRCKQLSVDAMKSGLRRTSIPGLGRAGLNQAKGVNEDSLDGEGRINNMVRLRNDTVA
jgi:hypothetical protein